jgi:hypothetical protein
MKLDEDKQLIKAFVEDEKMFEAVRRILLSGMLGTNFAHTNWVWNIKRELSDADYGAEVKTTRKALEWINGAWDEMKRTAAAASNPQPSKKNEAR